MIIWLASYPKSGNTWLRSLISSYYFSNNGTFDFNLLNYIDQFPAPKYFVDVKDNIVNPEDFSKYWLSKQSEINKDKKLRFFKTHAAMCKINNNPFTDNKNTLGAIYILRDPRNLITSLSNHYQLNLSESLDFMIEEKKALVDRVDNKFKAFVPIFSWRFHLKSWIHNKSFKTIVIRYEDLTNETYYTFKKVIEFIDKLANNKNKFDKEKAKKTIVSCNFKNLQNLEKNKGFSEALTKKNSKEKIKFFNLGKDNDYRKLLNEDLINKMNNIFQEELLKYKYE